MSAYTICEEATNEVIARVTDATIGDWWKENEDYYFGVRIIGNEIIVCKVQ